MAWLREEVDAADYGTIIEFTVPDPDLTSGMYTGQVLTVDSIEMIYRGYRSWTDLAELLFCRMLTPRALPHGMIAMRFEKLDTRDSFHRYEENNKSEKYGIRSRFFHINKNEEPSFLAAYERALQNVHISHKKRVLDLGVNTGDEFDLIKCVLLPEQYAQMELIGIDHSESAVKYAKERFPESNVTFHVHDINRLDTLNLGTFDLIITIGTLQSPGIEFKPFFMSLVQKYLSKNEGAMILGFPNCRWMGGEMIYGAKAPNYPFSEMSLLYKDVYYCKKYLQQKGFRVTLTGKGYLFLTATPIRKNTQASTS